MPLTTKDEEQLRFDEFMAEDTLQITRNYNWIGRMRIPMYYTDIPTRKNRPPVYGNRGVDSDTQVEGVRGMTYNSS